MHVVSFLARLASTRAPSAAGACVLLAICLAGLLIGGNLTPNRQGFGTHSQLGLPPCGFLVASGFPCMTCGMTTSVSLAAQGRLQDSARVQPGGLVVAIGLACGVWFSLHALIAGPGVWRLASNLFRTRVLIALGLVFAAAWATTILRWPPGL